MKEGGKEGRKTKWRKEGSGMEWTGVGGCYRGSGRGEGSKDGGVGGCYRGSERGDESKELGIATVTGARFPQERPAAGEIWWTGGEELCGMHWYVVRGDEWGR